MKTLCFSGISSDTFGEYGATGEECNNCACGEPVYCLITADNGRLLVVAQYAALHTGDCWTIGISMAEEGKRVPRWPIRIVNGECPYSPVLEVEVPDDAILEWKIGRAKFSA